MQTATQRLGATIVDHIFRHKAQMHALPLDQFKVSVAHTSHDYEAALQLVRAAYIVKGYEDLHSGQRRVTPFHFLDEHTVLVAREKDTVVGTMSVLKDSAHGLPLDELYPEELNRLRQSGAKLAELGNLAVVSRVRSSGATAVLNMAAYQLATQRLDVTHFVVQCVPRGLAAYRALFGFKQLGATIVKEDFGCRCVALALDLSTVRAFWKKHFRKPLSDGRSLHDHFVHGSPGIERPPPLSDPGFHQWKLPHHVVSDILLPEVGPLDSTWANTIGQVLRRRPVRLLESRGC